MRVGSQQCSQLGLENVRFLRANIVDIERFFSSGEVSEIWLVHPDPRPKNADRHRRLTYRRFLTMYQTMLKPGIT